MLMDLDTLQRHLPSLWEGFGWTALLTAMTLLAGMVIALPVAACRGSRNGFARAFAFVFVFAFRGAPLLVLLFLVYYGMPELPIVRETVLWTAFREPLFCAILALSFNSAGYLAEVIAGAVRSVPRGEIEAATTAGLSRWHVVTGVIAPNAIRLGLRNYGNEVVFVIKATAVASLVTISELMASANRIYYQTLDPFTPLLAAGLIYLVVVLALTRAIAALERYMSPEMRRRGAPQVSAALREGVMPPASPSGTP
ncbi:MAG: ABC transporter permease subunit [Pseudomonadota bacterium]